MGNITVSQFEKDMTWDGYLLVRSAEARTDKKGMSFLDMNVCDRTGEINCKKWGKDFTVPVPGSVVRIKGNIQEYNGRLQFVISALRPREESEAVDMNLLMPCAPREPADMKNQITETIGAFADEDLKKLVLRMLEYYRDKLDYFPAAQRIHHAEQAGLLHHITDMLKMADAVVSVYPGLNGDLLRAGIILHDLAKMDEMVSDPLGNVSDYSRDGILVGHIARIVIRLENAASELGLSGEMVTLLTHMLLSHHGEYEFGSPKLPMTAEAEALHWLDMMDARMNTIQGIQSRLKPGTFSEMIQNMDRRVYMPKYGWDQPNVRENAD